MVDVRGQKGLTIDLHILQIHPDLLEPRPPLSHVPVVSALATVVPPPLVGTRVGVGQPFGIELGIVALGWDGQVALGVGAVHLVAVDLQGEARDENSVVPIVEWWRRLMRLVWSVELILELRAVAWQA